MAACRGALVLSGSCRQFGGAPGIGREPRPSAGCAGPAPPAEWAEAGALMARTVGRRPDDALVAEVHRRTGGNPFFVEQAARLWQSGGPVEAIAPGVRDAVQQRLSLLPEAAVPGRRFHRRLPAAVTAEPVSGVDRPAGEVTVLAAARPGTNATPCPASSR